MPYANNKGADQPAHPRSLISAFVVRCLDSIIPLVSISEILSFCDCAGRFESTLVANPEDRFSRDEAQLCQWASQENFLSLAEGQYKTDTLVAGIYIREIKQSLFIKSIWRAITDEKVNHYGHFGLLHKSLNCISPSQLAFAANVMKSCETGISFDNHLTPPSFKNGQTAWV